MITPHISGVIDWQIVNNIFPATATMETTVQNPRYHAEGNVKIHTEMAFSELLKLPEYKQLSERDKNTLEWAVILHDIGKTCTTREENGEITSKGHSRIGRDIVLKDIWKFGYQNFPLEVRQEIAGLIAMHGRPSFLLKGVPFNKDYSPEAIVIQCSQYCRNDLLIPLAKADTLGRLTTEKPDTAILGLYQDAASELNCLDSPFKFSNSLSRYKFLHSLSGNYHYQAFEEFRTTCHVLFGCPGAGKSTYIKQCFPNCTVISTDELRAELGLKAGSAAPEVFVLAYERLKAAIRRREEVVWDATNTKLIFRQKPLGIAEDYNCKTVLHIIDRDFETCRNQDAKRKDPVGVSVLNLFSRSLTFPDIKEAIEIKNI